MDAASHATPGQGRLILVSNRLPVKIQGEPGALQLKRTSGGLATGLSRPHKETGGRWIGWPGITTEGKQHSAEVRDLLNAQGMTGIPLTPSEHEQYYTGTSNRCLWPLLHYFTDKVNYDTDAWNTYEAVNRRFAECAAREAQPGDLVFVQDFHLMLVPAMLRQLRPDVRIGFFLHVPFPSSEIFRVFPRRAQILEGLLGADVLGFHTLEYVRHFRSTVRRVLGVETGSSEILWHGREIQLLAQPLGIDPAPWNGPVEDLGDIPDLAGLEEAIVGRKIVLGVERLDYTKGIPERLQAFHDLLASDPTLVEKVMMIQIAVPSRADAEEYQELRDEVDRLAGQINGTFGRPGLQPLHYQFRGIAPGALKALYRLADVALVTPLRDGLNLVAKEFVCSRTADDGVLVLGEFAGAAWELGEAVQVNPYDISAITEALRTALAMPSYEQARRIAPMRKRVREHDVYRWTEACLDAISGAQRRSAPMLLEGAERRGWDESWAEARDRMLLLDYDGTLREFTERPEDASPPPELVRLLTSLAQSEGVEGWIVSGRPADVLDSWLGATGMGLIAEHGGLVRPAGANAFEEIFERPMEGWREGVEQILSQFTSRVPGSRMEFKPLGLAWHYRGADLASASWQARELYQHLSEVLAGQGLEVQSGNRVIEVRPAGSSKGRAVKRVLAARADTPDLIAFAGDDVTDESLFRELPSSALTLLVGERPSAARFSLPTPAAFREVLHSWQAALGPAASNR